MLEKVCRWGWALRLLFSLLLDQDVAISYCPSVCLHTAMLLAIITTTLLNCKPAPVTASSHKGCLGHGVSSVTKSDRLREEGTQVPLKMEDGSLRQGLWVDCEGTVGAESEAMALSRTTEEMQTCWPIPAASSQDWKRMNLCCFESLSLLSFVPVALGAPETVEFPMCPLMEKEKVSSLR